MLPFTKFSKFTSGGRLSFLAATGNISGSPCRGDVPTLQLCSGGELCYLIVERTKVHPLPAGEKTGRDDAGKDVAAETQRHD